MAGINYNDERFTKVNDEKNAALTESEKMYDDMIDQSDSYFDKQIDASKDWADKQTQLQQEQTDFTIEKIEQQKDEAEKQYQKEQRAAYSDWQKQSNKYGPQAEQMATNGLELSGYSESSQVAMYNAYQNRVAIGRQSFNLAVLNYDNAMKEARLQNNSKLAEIAYTALIQELELSLQGFQYKNQLLLQKADKKAQIEDTYYGRFQDVVNQINTENALAEQRRQFNASLSAQGGSGVIDKTSSEAQNFETNIYSEKEFKSEAETITRGGRGNTGNGGYRLNGVHYQSYDAYVLAQIKASYESGSMSEETCTYLLEKYGF